VEDRHQRIAALEREALGGRIANLEELLETFGLDELIEEPQPSRVGEHGLVEGRLHLLLEPDALLPIEDVEILGGDGAAVGRLQAGHQPAQWHPAAAAEAARVDHPIEILLGEAEVRGLEQRMALRLRSERIQMRDQVTELAIRVDQVVDALERAVLLRRRRLGLRPGHGDGRRGRAIASLPAELEAGEEEGPALVDGMWICLPAAA